MALCVPWSLDLDPLLDGPRARLAGIMKLSKPTYHIKTRQELAKRESLKAYVRKLYYPIKDSLHGGPSRVSSPPTGHPTAYGKFVMDKHTKAENTQKRYLLAGFPVFKSLIFGILIFDKEEQILSLKLRDFIPKIKGRLVNHAL